MTDEAETYQAITLPYSNNRIFRHVGWDEYIKTHNSVNRFPDSYAVRDEVWDWCESMFKGKWWWSANHLPKGHPLKGIILQFTDANEAMMFKLTWCGTI